MLPLWAIVVATAIVVAVAAAGGGLWLARSNRAVRPRGTLAVVDRGHNDSSNSCVHWSFGFVNNSDAEIVELTFVPGDAEYVDLQVPRENGPPDSLTGRRPLVVLPRQPPIKAERPSAVVLNVSLPSHSAEQVLDFDTCTSTPAVPFFAITVSPPPTIAFRWETGYTGEARI